MNGYYYLHTNGSLIFKPDSFDPKDFDSSFVKEWWRIDTQDRKTAWNVIIEGLALGAKLDDVKRLVKKWNCTKKDLPHYLVNQKPTDLRRQGVRIFLEKIGQVDPDKWFDWLAQQEGELDFSTMP